LNTLSALGITIQQNGQLKLDKDVLSGAINTSATEVVEALNAYGKSFNTEVTALLSSDGSVSNRISSLDSTVRRYKESQEAMEVRVSLVEKRYRAQFTALDKLVSSMQTTSSYLTQQLAALQNSS
jgi:flagellar hook-associated protein 2